MREVVIDRIGEFVFKSFTLALEDKIKADFFHAHKTVYENFKLSTKDMRYIEGQARFRVISAGFEEVCSQFGGVRIHGDVIPGTNLKVFQPFMRFDGKGAGVIIGLATIQERKSIPRVNKSRLAGVSLNYYLTPRLDLNDNSPKVGDIFVLVLVSPDAERAGIVEEIAFGIIDSKYQSYLYYEKFDDVLALKNYDQPSSMQNATLYEKPEIRLKNKIVPFEPRGNEG